MRRHVLHRDHGRCVVPGCSHGKFLDVHHLCARAEGGTHEPDNLVTLCAGHHAALHAGQLSIAGRPSTKLRFSRADGKSYTEPPSARSIAVSEQVIRGLCRLGFSERESKAAVAHGIEAVETPCPEAVLRAALAVLSARPPTAIGFWPGEVEPRSSSSSTRVASFSE
ncbi:MAG TPA: HNH endonuclease [Polyangiaceae bacterium]|nr:HNH endonuclease [Polyangiaceae bacterium]